MNKKKAALLVGLFGLGSLGIGVRYYLKAQEEKKKAQALAQVREYFEEKGQIATVFIYEEQSAKDFLKGGVVMEEGAVYLFENHFGLIHYEEERL